MGFPEGSLGASNTRWIFPVPIIPLSLWGYQQTQSKFTLPQAELCPQPASDIFPFAFSWTLMANLLLLFVYVYICMHALHMCVCTCGHMCACIYVYTWVKARGWHQFSSLTFHFISWGRVSSWSQTSLILLVSLASLPQEPCGYASWVLGP